MAARLYTNENFHQGVVERLRSLGHDVLTTLEAGRANQRIPDEEVVAFAIRDSRVVVTFNRRDFRRLYSSLEGVHSGIIVCTMDSDLDALAKRIDDTIGANAPLQGTLVEIRRPAK